MRSPKKSGPADQQDLAEQEMHKTANRVTFDKRVMDFVSYSANCEDVILRRIFGNEPNGFYIDVGAAHPTFENDTKLLYDSGWHGINIEPNKEFFDVLARERTRDVNLNMVLSDTIGAIDFY